MKVLRWAALAALVVAITGCPKDKEPVGGSNVASSGGSATSKIVIAVLPKGTAQSFWLTVKAGADDAAKAGNATIDWNGPAAETEVDRQITILQGEISKKVSGIVMAACDAKGLSQYAKAAKDAGIPVVTIDSGVDPDVTDAYLATDNVKGGAAAADALATAIGGKGKVGLMPFIKGAQSSDGRENGFRNRLKEKYPNIELVESAVLYSESKTDVALDKMKAMLTSNRDLVGAFIANQGGAEGAIQAVKSMGKTGQVKLVCFDSSKPEVDALRDGTVSALVVQNPYQMGFKGVETVLRLIKNPKEKIEPHTIDTGIATVTNDNMDTPEIQKLIK